MKKICLLAIPTIAAALITTAAQQPTTNTTPQNPSTAKPTPTPAPPAARSMPNDKKAYKDASRIKDPQKRIEALEKFLDQYPESLFTSAAHLAILNAIIKGQPESKDKILAQAEKTLQEESGAASSGSIASDIASRLAKVGLLAEAQQYAQQSLVSTDEYLAQTVN